MVTTVILTNLLIRVNKHIPIVILSFNDFNLKKNSYTKNPLIILFLFKIKYVTGISTTIKNIIKIFLKENAVC